MSKGFLWFCQNNNETDYTKLSIELARTIKKHNKENRVCVVVDESSIFQSEWVDDIKILKQDDADGHTKKFANEYKAFALTPYTHTIKLEADMLWNSNTDWWWHYLCQHDLVFSVDCLNYQEQRVRDVTYRPYHRDNFLPNVYNGMTYFRKSTRAQTFFDLCKTVVQNWSTVKEELLRKCFDTDPTTDIVYALAYRLMDPTCEQLIDYPWFKFIHNKPSIHQTRYTYDPLNFYYPVRSQDSVYFGGRRITAPLHYYYKNFLEVLDARVF
jgi:hypothetical protein